MSIPTTSFPSSNNRRHKADPINPAEPVTIIFFRFLFIKYNQINISCSHTGYAKQGKGIWHIRNWLMKDNEIEVIDQIKGEYNTATSRVIFHPNVSITRKHNSIFDIHLLSGKRLKLKLLNGDGKIIKVKHAIEFGKVLDTKCLLIQINDSNSHYKLTW